MLTAKHVSFSRGTQLVLDRISVSVGPQTRLGVVGPNGIGKSTLLRILAGEIPPTSGSVERSPAALRVGYLAQEPDARAGETILAYLARRTGVAQAEDELDRWTRRLEQDLSALDRYSEALERYVGLGGDDFEARAASVATSAGLPGERLGAPMAHLSGGQSARAGLAAILLARFDVFLLDEPTNDLDFAGLEQLERFLASVNGGVVVVSHDRAFLDRSVTRILELQEHHRTAVDFAGGWSEFIERRQLARSQQQESYQTWQAERRRLQDRVRTQRAWSEQGVARAKREARDKDKFQQGFFANRTERQASKVRSSERALQRLGTVEKPWEGWQLHLELAPTERSGQVVARLDDAVAERPGFRLGPVDLEISWADRVAITGPNGSGKSTLLAALLGELPLAAGSSWVGPSVVAGRLDQRRDRFDRADTLLDGFCAATGLLVEEARSTLAKFGLGPSAIFRPARNLSPGERTRATLAELMVRGVNCLVLDEPTNHLDLPAIEELEGALEGFGGTLLLVTHDRWLVESVRVTRHVHVEDGRVSET